MLLLLGPDARQTQHDCHMLETSGGSSTRSSVAVCSCSSLLPLLLRCHTAQIPQLAMQPHLTKTWMSRPPQPSL